MGNEAKQKKEVDAVKMKKAYEDLNDARLREAEANLALFEATARKSGVKSDIENVSGLRAKRDSYHAKLQEIKRASESNWEQYKPTGGSYDLEMGRAVQRVQAT